MAVKVSKFLHNLLLQANPLSERFNPENLREAKVPKPLTLPTLEEWNEDVGLWEDPPPEEGAQDDV